LLLFGFLIAFVHAQSETSETDTESDSETSDTETDTETDTGEDSGTVTTEAPTVILDNDVVSNYYLGSFQDTYFFPYAVGHCTASGIDSTSFLMAECNSDGTITVSDYTEGTCGGSPVSVNTYNSSFADFSCDGGDFYVDMNIGVTDCDGLEFHVIAALDVCVFGGNAYVTVYCMDNYAELQYYGAPTCPAAYLAATASATDECNAAGFLQLTSAIIYGKVADCSQGGTTEAPASAASVHSTIVCLFISAVLAVLKL